MSATPYADAVRAAVGIGSDIWEQFLPSDLVVGELKLTMRSPAIRDQGAMDRGASESRHPLARNSMTEYRAERPVAL